MKLTINIPAKFVKLVNESFKEVAGRDMTEKQLIKYFQQDIKEMYFNDDFAYQLEDAMDAYLSVKYKL